MLGIQIVGFLLSIPLFKEYSQDDIYIYTDVDGVRITCIIIRTCFLYSFLIITFSVTIRDSFNSGLNNKWKME